MLARPSTHEFLIKFRISAGGGAPMFAQLSLRMVEKFQLAKKSFFTKVAYSHLDEI